VTTSSGPLIVTQYNDGNGVVSVGPALTSSFQSQYTTVTATGIATALESPALIHGTTAVLANTQNIQIGTVLNFTQTVGGVTTNSGPQTVSIVDPSTNKVTFAPGLPSEFDGTTVTSGAATTALAVSANVGDTTIVVASLQGITFPGTITLTQGATSEGPLTIASLIPATNSIVLSVVGGLTSAFTATTVNATTVPATTLTAANAIGDSSVVLTSVVGIQAGSVIYLSQAVGGVTTGSGPLTVSGVNTATSTVTFSPSLASVFAVASTTVTVSPSTPFLVAANNGGAWGNNIHITIASSSRAQAQVQSVSDSSPGVHDTVLLNSAANFYVGAIVEFSRGASKVYAKVKSVLGSSIQVLTAFPSTTYLNPDSGTVTTARTCEFDVSDSYGTVHETFRGLTLDDSTPYYYGKVIANGSSLLSIPSSAGSDDSSQNPFTMPVGLDGLDGLMSGGDDGSIPTSDDIVGVDLGPGNRNGIQALIDIDQISIIGAPGICDQDTQNALIDQCETLKYRFAILDPAPDSATGGTPTMNDVQTQRNLYDTHYAAIYYPRVVVTDPLSGNPLAIPPSGHIAGIYAQTDATRGVWKAPANVVINSILSLEVKLSKGDQDILNPEPVNINALRDFTAQGRGLRVYGARCITSDAEWMYVPVRRTFIFLEASLDQGTQWAVFEPNNQQLWNRLIQSVSSFLTTIWQQGGLMGATADQAFFVKCGLDTMSSDDIDNGRLIMLVGVAPVFPAEFVIIQIGQWAGGSSVQEL
jgi:hypothetical protein